MSGAAMGVRAMPLVEAQAQGEAPHRARPGVPSPERLRLFEAYVAGGGLLTMFLARNAKASQAESRTTS